jgi:hypothetical protein
VRAPVAGRARVGVLEELELDLALPIFAVPVTSRFVVAPASNANVVIFSTSVA